ncbi:MAG: hypothetical protein ACOCVY_03045 [Patescibacteria group bacterium]
MTPEKWQQIIGEIKDNFEVEKNEKERIEEEGGVDIEYIIFKGPLGKMKLEFVTKPLIIDKKTNYSLRIGSESNVEYVYSDTEKTHQLYAFKWDEENNDWMEIDAESMFS